MPLQATSGAASYDAFGGGVPVAANYIEDVFSTWLYAGTDATTSINNGIDLSTKGGMTWIKCRNDPRSHAIFDTARGVNNWLTSNATTAQTTTAGSLTAFNTNGFTISTGLTNVNGDASINFASWTFREQPKFFDVVTYTGNGTSQNIAHNLGSVPGCFIVKATSTTGNWAVYHRSLSQVLVNDAYIRLNQTAAAGSDTSYWNNVLPTSTTFTVGSHPDVNTNGVTYVAYLFAHNAGGFGLTGTDNVISCGSYTGNGSTSGPEINLGYEPQYVLIKNASATGFWFAFDSMRGIATGGTDALLFPNVADAEANSTDNIDLTATGFRIKNSAGSINGNGNTLIYIAIRRGPMRTPTTGTSVLGLRARTGTGANATVTNGFADLAIIKNRGSAVNWLWSSRLTGTGYLSSNDTSVGEVAAGATILQANPWDVMDGVKVGTTSNLTNASGNTFINYLLDRAPGFMDVCCYTGTGTARTVAHNLGVVPELMIVRSRSGGRAWTIYASSLGATKYLEFSTALALTSSTRWNDTAPTSSVFTVGTAAGTNANTENYIAYLFASCPGVSKVGSYVGNGTNQIINCGFASSARFILIKGVDVETRDWYLWDTARGIVVGNDSILNPNTSAAQTTGFDDVEADSTGFKVLQGGAQVNTSGYNYIFLAIA